MGWLAIAVLVVAVAFLAFGRNRARHGAPGAATNDLVVDERGAQRSLADGRREEVEWAELTRVELVRAHKGPHAASGGVVMLAGDAERGCLVPLDRIGGSGLVGQLARLPGFDVDGFVRALQDESRDEVVCWERPEPGDAL